LTRRYHGLLIAPVEPPLGRWLVFSKADATLLDGDREIPLFSNRWSGGAMVPEGHVHLESFHLHGRMPVWRYALGDRVIEQRIWLEPGANTVYVAYRLESTDTDRDLRLQVRLLVNARDHHVSMMPGGFTPQSGESRGAIACRSTPTGSPCVFKPWAASFRPRGIGSRISIYRWSGSAACRIETRICASVRRC
jgi:hypothetical protein